MNRSKDCAEIGEAIKAVRENSRGTQLVLADDGEIVAVSASQSDQMRGIKVGEIAKKDYYLL